MVRVRGIIAPSGQNLIIFILRGFSSYRPTAGKFRVLGKSVDFSSLGIFPNGRLIERFFGSFGPEICGKFLYFWGWALGSPLRGEKGVFGRRRTVSLSLGRISSLLKFGRGPNRSLRCTLFFQFAGVVLAPFEKKCAP